MGIWRFKVWRICRFGAAETRRKALCREGLRLVAPCHPVTARACPAMKDCRVIAAIIRWRVGEAAVVRHHVRW